MVSPFGAHMNVSLKETLVANPWVMSISSFFNSFAGMYVAQSFCHSLIAAVVTNQALKAWRIHDPLVSQRFRFLIILFPILSFPFYQMINPDRGSTLFRLEALFDINRWLAVEIGGLVPVALLFLLLLALTSLIFFFQEMVPVVRNTLDSRQPDEDRALLETGPFLENAAQTLGIKTPEVVLIEDDEPHIFSATGRDPAIFVSSGLTKALDQRQMEAALAHEMGHIARSRRPLLIIAFILRIIMFYNPVVMVKFRKAIRDEEKICDDIAVTLTRDPAALASALKVFYHKIDEPPEQQTSSQPPRKGSIEEYSHNLLLESRIQRLESRSMDRSTGWGLPFVVTLLTIMVLNYYIV